MLKKQGAKSRPKLRVSIQHLNFNQSNLDATRVEIGKREYGFIKTTNARDTPIPKKRYDLNNDELKQRLDNLDSFYNSTSTSSDSSFSNLQTEDVPEEMSFEMKRKLFHEGEFTITRGKVTSDMVHPEVNYTLPKQSLIDSEAQTWKDMEDFCHARNIKISRGYQ